MAVAVVETWSAVHASPVWGRLWSCTQQAVCVHQGWGEPFLGSGSMCLKGLWGRHLLGSGHLESTRELQAQVAVGYGSGSLDQVRLGEALLHAMM